MKHIVIRCEDRAPAEQALSSLLDGAKTPALLQLAQAGAAGRLRWPGAQPADRFALHQALLGLEAWPAGWCYAAAANVQLEPDETAWCCDLVTQRDGQIIDPSAGGIASIESRILLQSLDQQLSSDIRRWEPGEGGHHVLVTSDPALRADEGTAVPSAAVLAGQAWTRRLPAGRVGDALRALLDAAARILEPHPINRVRVDLGENPANLVWLWGGGMPARGTAPASRAVAILSDSFAVRGLARAAGLTASAGLSSAFGEQEVKACAGAALAALERHDAVYIHAQVRSTDPVERLCAMERIDQHLIKLLAGSLSRTGPWRLLAAVDGRDGQVPCIAIGTGLPKQPVARLGAEQLEASPLVFEGGRRLREWFLDEPA